VRDLHGRISAPATSDGQTPLQGTETKLLFLTADKQGWGRNAREGRLPGESARHDLHAANMRLDSLIRGFELDPWQEDAVVAWEKGDTKGPHRGTLEVFTGGGKTLIALACFDRAARITQEVRLAVVVPTEALAYQWAEKVQAYTTVPAGQIGILGAGRKGSLSKFRVLICVLNTAAKKLPEMAASTGPLMLVVDECHRAGARTFSRVLESPASFRLGLSATPEREEVDEHGEPLVYDEQLLGHLLGSVVYRFTLRDARRMGWLPEYEIHHHGISLTREERHDYEQISRRIDDLSDKLNGRGWQTSQARRLSVRNDDIGRLAKAYVAATSRRKDLLYRADERERVATWIVWETTRGGGQRPRILLFHERVEEAVELFNSLNAVIQGHQLALEHSRLPTAERRRALQKFRDGDVNILVSVKSLIEGIDVPEADVGISVASTSSVRQRIQSLGRVLRRPRDGTAKRARMYLIYVADTVDESIYNKEDWSDLTGRGANQYWRWTTDRQAPPCREEGPPQEPRPTEEQEWERLGKQVPAGPEPWRGCIPTVEYSVDARGTVTNSRGEVIANSQGVDEMVAAVRGRPGGRFYVTPLYRLVIVMGERSGGSQAFIAGRIFDPFEVRQLGEDGGSEAALSAEDLQPGCFYRGPTTRVQGTYYVRQKRGGVIERRDHGGLTEFALTEGEPRREANARRLLEAWRQVSAQGFEFYVNELGHAWYLEKGEPKFLAIVQGGFAWPEPEAQ